MARRQQRRFGDLVHVGRIYIGGRTEAGKPTPKKAIQAMVGRVAAATGGMTATRARGIFRSAKQPFVSEPSTAIETFVDAGRSCEKFKKTLASIGEKAAREGLQESVAVVVQCAGKPVDAVFVTPKKKH